MFLVSSIIYRVDNDSGSMQLADIFAAKDRHDLKALRRQRRVEKVETTAVTIAGGIACSYPCEALALVSGLEEMCNTIIDAAQQHDLADPTRPALLVVTDSLSFLSAINRGPCDVGDYFSMRAWDALLKLARRGIDVYMTFVFSHCEIAIHDNVDKLARRAAAGKLGAVTVPPWHKDVARIGKSAVRAEAQAKYEKAGTWRSQYHRNFLTSELLTLPLPVAKHISRMRTGLVPEFGGTLYDGTEPVMETCPLCKDPERRFGRGAANKGNTGVDHALTCQADDAVKKRLELFFTRRRRGGSGTGSFGRRKRAASASTTSPTSATAASGYAAAVDPAWLWDSRRTQQFLDYHRWFGARRIEAGHVPLGAPQPAPHVAAAAAAIPVQAPVQAGLFRATRKAKMKQQ